MKDQQLWYVTQRVRVTNYFDKFFKFIGERTEGILRRYKIKITDQLEVLFKQKR